MTSDVAQPAAVRRVWEDEILPTLSEYTRIPCLSPAYAPDWAADGHLVRAARLLADWCLGRAVPGLVADVVELPGRTPVLLVEVP
ncbi:MAG TPA: peptidase M20, partial [Acidimicrobiales bacterium]